MPLGEGMKKGLFADVDENIENFVSRILVEQRKDLDEFLSLPQDKQEKFLVKLLKQNKPMIPFIRKNLKLVDEFHEFKHLNIPKILAQVNRR